MNRKIAISVAVIAALQSQMVAAQEATPSPPLAWAGIEAPADSTTPPSGALESNFIVAALVGALASKIRQNVAPRIPAGTMYIIPTLDGNYGDLAASARMQRQIGIWQGQIDAIAPGDRCPPPRLADTTNLQSGGPDLSAQALVSSLVDLLRNSRTITQVDTTAGAHLVLANLMSQNIGDVNWLNPSLRTLPEPVPGGISDQFTSAIGRAIRVAQLPCGATEANKAVLSTIVEEMQQAAMPAAGSDVSPLEMAIRLEELELSQSLLMRVSIADEGGTAIQTSNIWTILGARDLHYSGGIIASYQLVSPQTGVVLASGSVRCMAPVQSFEAVHRLGVLNLDRACS